MRSLTVSEISGVSGGETEEERVARLAENVYQDYPELRALGADFIVEHGLRTFDLSEMGFVPVLGRWKGGDDVALNLDPVSDEILQATIFEELLHMQEAKLAGFEGNRAAYILHEMADGFHDDCIDKAVDEYEKYLDPLDGVQPLPEYTFEGNC